MQKKNQNPIGNGYQHYGAKTYGRGLIPLEPHARWFLTQRPSASPSHRHLGVCSARPSGQRGSGVIDVISPAAAATRPRAGMRACVCGTRPPPLVSHVIATTGSARSGRIGPAPLPPGAATSTRRQTAVCRSTRTPPTSPGRGDLAAKFFFFLGRQAFADRPGCGNLRRKFRGTGPVDDHWRRGNFPAAIPHGGRLTSAARGFRPGWGPLHQAIRRTVLTFARTLLFDGIGAIAISSSLDSTISSISSISRSPRSGLSGSSIVCGSWASATDLRHHH